MAWTPFLKQIYKTQSVVLNNSKTVTKSSTLHWSARTFASQRLSSAAQQTYLNQVWAMTSILRSKLWMAVYKYLSHHPVSLEDEARDGCPVNECKEDAETTSVPDWRLADGVWKLHSSRGTEGAETHLDKKASCVWLRTNIQHNLHCTKVTKFEDHNPATWRRLAPHACHKEAQNESGPKLHELKKANRLTNEYQACK